MTSQTYIFYGSSGSGKGTQASLLKEYLEKRDIENKTLYIETGLHLREFIKRNNYSSKLTKNLLENGKLLPEFLPIWIWTNFFVENFKTGKEHLILDGLARRMDEAPVLDKALKFYSRENPEVIILNVSREWSIERLLERGRHDDNKEHIERRIDWYDANVVPTIKFFRNNSDYIIHDIDGEQTIEKVHLDIIQKLQNISVKSQ